MQASVWGADPHLCCARLIPCAVLEASAVPARRSALICCKCALALCCCVSSRMRQARLIRRHHAHLGRCAVMPGDGGPTGQPMGNLDTGHAGTCIPVVLPCFTHSTMLPCRGCPFQLPNAVSLHAVLARKAIGLSGSRMLLLLQQGFLRGVCLCARLRRGHPAALCAAPFNAPPQA